MSLIVYACVHGYLESKYSIYEFAPADRTVCQDGWLSYSSGSGTCSHHGGIKIFAGGRMATGEFQPGWWEKEKLKLYVILSALIMLSIVTAAIMSTRPYDLTPEQRKLVDTAMKAFEHNLAETARNLRTASKR